MQTVSEEIAIGVPKGFFGRGAVVHTSVNEDSGCWVVFLERSSDNATFWKAVTFLGLNSELNKRDEVNHSYAFAKLSNALARCEEMQTSEPLVKIDCSKGWFDDALRKHRQAEDSPFMFFDPIVKEEFAKLADAYGFKVVEPE